MRKHKARSRANNFGTAELMEWSRYIENPELKTVIVEIRAKMKLPLSSGNNLITFEDPIYIDWMGWDEPNKAIKSDKDKRRKKLLKEVKKLLDKYHIPSHYFGSLFDFVITGNESISYQSKGFPSFKYQPNEDGEWIHECIITLETDLGNPLVLDTIKKWQMIYKTKPPIPIKIGRAKDWRPVWEWRNRNPGISDREIAEMLHLSRAVVNRALRNLDKANVAKQR